MKRRDFLRGALVIGSGGAVVLARHAQAQNEARALRLVFSRGGELFVSPGMDGTDARRVLTVGTGALWAVSPDGRRVVWMPRYDPNTSKATVFLSDLIGRHQKKLFATDELRDRQGQPVKLAGAERGTDATGLGIGSVGWSADGRTVYIGTHFYEKGTPGGRATFGVDAVSGAAVVNGDGHWKPIAFAANVDAQGSLLVGVSDELPLPEQANTATTGSGALVVTNLAESGIRTVFGSRKPLVGGAMMAPYDYVEYPAISPDHRTIAYVSGIDSGLWLRDRWGTNPPTPLKIVPSAIGKPRWTDDGKALYFISRSGSGNVGRDIYDLYQLDVPTPYDSGTPRLVLKNVDAFALAPV